MARALAGSACAGSSAAAASGSSTPPYIICASYTGSLSAARKRPEHGGQKGYGEPPRRLSASFRTFHRSARTAAAELFGRAMSEGALDGALRRRKPRGQTTPVISQQALKGQIIAERQLDRNLAFDGRGWGCLERARPVNVADAAFGLNLQ